MPELPQGVRSVFLSHNGRQKQWVRRLAAQWRGLGLRVFYDEDSVMPGEDVIAAIERGITGCDHVVLVLSPAALTSQWVAMEIAMTRIGDPSGRDRRLIPILIEPVDSESIRPAIRCLSIVDLTEPDRRNERYHHLLRSLGLDRPDLPDPPAFEDEPLPVPAFDATGTAAPNGDGGAPVATVTRQLGFELVIDGDLDDFDPQAQQKLFAAIKELLETGDELKIRNIRRGSIIVTLDLSPEQAERLFWAVQRGELDELGVREGRVLDEDDEAEDDEARERWQAEGSRTVLDRIVREGRGHSLPVHSAPVFRHANAAPGEPRPLSFAQERLWFLYQLQSENPYYNLSGTARIRGVLDYASIERALQEIVHRHEVLRSTFHTSHGYPVAVVDAQPRCALVVTGLTEVNDATRASVLRRLITDQALQPFDLGTGPLLRVMVAALRPTEHLLQLTVPRIVGDEWSLGLLFRELLALYRAYRYGRESPLSELTLQYADFAARQRELLAGTWVERQLTWWKERLAGAPALLELPTDRPRPAVRSDHVGNERIEVSRELHETLRELARREELTLYEVLLGAFQMLLAKYSGSNDVLVGTRVAGRRTSVLEEMVGCLANTVVMRTDLSGNPCIREVLARVRMGVMGAYAHQQLPFEVLVEELRPERSLSHNPLIQVWFALNSKLELSDFLPGLQMEPVEAPLATPGFDLDLLFIEHSGGLRGVLRYSSDLFERNTIERMLCHLKRVLEQVAEQPKLLVSELQLLTDAERQQVISEWNDTDREYALVPVHEQFALQARRAPDAVALLHAEGAMTYAELDRRANALARHLRELGVGSEARVGVCMAPTPDLLATILATWKAGGACVPLDPRYPAERLDCMILDAGISVVLTGGSASQAFTQPRANVLRVDQLGGEEDGAPAVFSDLRNLACVIYTSCPTGMPRGVMVEHGSLAHLLAAACETFDVQPSDVVPLLAPLVSDAWLIEALLPLASGAAVRLIDRSQVLDVPSIVAQIADATLLHAVPAFLQEVGRTESSAPRLQRLRRVFIGGEAAPPGLLEENRLTFRSAETHVLYGAIEGAVVASAHRVAFERDLDARVIGRPLANVRLYVCDARGNPQPPGIPGELLIGGAGVARGYLNHPAATAERFIPNPFGGRAGARLYRTGDRARWRADGMLEYLGRLDRQVRLFGFRVEPGEVEAMLCRHPRVRGCAVVTSVDSRGETRLTAYVVGDASPEALRSHLGHLLPEYMVPAAFVYLDALPLNARGKVDLGALPQPDFTSTRPYVPPRTLVEKMLAEIWAEVLGVERVGVEDDFFLLGGHSLRATQVLARVRRALEVEVPLRVLFETPTVAGVAAWVEAGGGALADALAELEGLSDDEVAALLAEIGDEP
ncbi:MAG TPA: amino acid adenylation domain-containing protein [Longimicrobium sp.]